MDALPREALPREDHYRWLHISNPMVLLIRARVRGKRNMTYYVHLVNWSI